MGGPSDGELLLARLPRVVNDVYAARRVVCGGARFCLGNESTQHTYAVPADYLHPLA